MSKEDKTEETMRLIRRAKVSLMSDHPFFADLAFTMPVKIDDTLNPPTAATDGEALYYHPAFVKAMTTEELVFVTGHEVLHAALLHVPRRNGRDNRWLIATDIVVNQLLHNNKVGKMPKDLIFEPQLFAQGQGMVEQIYDLLPKDYSKKALDDFVAGGKIDPAKWRGKLAQAAGVAKGCGKMPGDLEQFVDQVISDTVAWEDELFNEITTYRGDERTYAKRNRRYAAQNIILPGKYGEKVGDLVFAIDCSGSTSDAMVAKAANNIERAMRVLRPEKTHVLYFDTTIKKHEEYEPDEELKVKAYGRGGTAFSPIFEYIEANGIEPQYCIVATDLDCYDFGTEPDYPVIWCVMESQMEHAPWGKMIHTDRR